MFLLKNKPSHHDRILKHLKKCGRYGSWNYELARESIGGLAWHRRITDLRKEGHNIVKARMTGGSFKYYLVMEDPLET